jgi:quercetin dioxygenase-like cupin family protein
MANEAKIKLAMVSNLWIKLMNFESAGDINHGHKHEFDHVTLLTKGSVEVDVDGTKSTFIAPQIIYIQKQTVHTITALEDGTIASCIVAIRNSEKLEDIVDPEFVPKVTNAEYLTDYRIPVDFV